MIIFFAVAVWNIIASIFYENIIKSAAVDQEEEMLMQRRQNMEDAKELMALCRNADLDESGTLSRLEFERFMECPRIRHFFQDRGLDIRNAAHFFDLMNTITGVDDIDVLWFT
eukprot:TRINITY_DN11824_c0_g4_i5.p1 TRINITY_DN11824_c0_g4~~TRINITY_DN11824_c0_g4_i5.p1  ORF type:complete len:113 (-),score=17.93 TRINITY_DN11824_c0_g4_i5:40-378(-)